MRERDGYSITEYQRYWNEGERQAYRLQSEFRELWPEFETPNELARQIVPHLDSDARAPRRCRCGAGEGVMGEVIRMPLRPGSEPWLSKRQIADHFGYSTRWVELRVKDGMPSQMIGGHRRFRLSECEQWLLERGVGVIVKRGNGYGVSVYDPALKRKRWVGTFGTKA